jgi:hypothetical protein
MNEPSEALEKDGVEGWDYILHPEVECVWITVNNISVYVRRTDEGVAVSLYPKGRECDDEICGTWCLYSEAEAEEEEDEDDNPSDT